MIGVRGWPTRTEATNARTVASSSSSLNAIMPQQLVPNATVMTSAGTPAIASATTSSPRPDPA